LRVPKQPFITIQIKIRHIAIALTNILCVNFICTAQEKSDVDIYEMDLEMVMDLSLNKASVIGLPHPHTKGELHVKYMWMYMPMSDNYDGTTKISIDDVLNNYGFGMGPMMMRMAPTHMTMKMHMMMLMYSPSDHLTIMAMTNYHQIDMNVQTLDMTGESMKFTTESNSIGDTRVMAYYALRNRNVSSVLVDIGLSIPTGSIAQTDKTPLSSDSDIQLTYPMQTGSGTFDPIVEGVYLGSTSKSSWGVSGQARLRLYDNSHDYRLGNQYSAVAGGGYNWKDWVATTVRLDFIHNGNISGADPNMYPMMMPTARPDLRAGNRIDGSLGIVFEVPHGNLEGLALIVDYRYPFYQNLAGPQMGLDYHLSIGLQFIHGENKL
jgi:hypothetical protein